MAAVNEVVLSPRATGTSCSEREVSLATVFGVLKLGGQKGEGSFTSVWPFRVWGAHDEVEAAEVASDRALSRVLVVRCTDRGCVPGARCSGQSEGPGEREGGSLAQNTP